MTEEHHKDYHDLTEIKVELATTNAHLANIIKMFHDHLIDDKATAKRVSDLEISDSNRKTEMRMVGIAGLVLGFFINAGIRLWEK